MCCQPRPWLVSLAEGAGKFAIAVLRKKPKAWRETDADLAGWCGRWAWHWARLSDGGD